MAVDDSLQSVLSHAWIASLVAAPDVVVGVPGCRYPKSSTEDTLLAESLKTPSSLTTCLYFYLPPSSPTAAISHVSTVMTLGSGMNGHSHILHGGMVATLLDESMGIFTSCNEHRAYFERTGDRKEDKGQTPKFTAELKVTYLKPVRTPTTCVIEVTSTRKEGRKEWMLAEMRQEQEGRVVLCARGEGLFVEARMGKI